MIANPSSSLNTALRGGAAASGQTPASSPVVRSNATSAPASSEFSRMLEHNQAAARQTQATTRARQADRAAADAPVDPATAPSASAPANASAPESATPAQDQAEASATDPTAVPGDAARSARSLTARDKADPALSTRADTAKATAAAGLPEALSADTDADADADAGVDAAPLPVTAGAMPVPPVVPATVNLATVTPSVSAASGDAAATIDAAAPGVASGKPAGPHEAGQTVRNATAAAAATTTTTRTATLSDSLSVLPEVNRAARADGASFLDTALPAAAAPAEAALVDPSAVALRAAAGRDQSVTETAARESSERPVRAPEAMSDAALAALSRSALAEPAQRNSTGSDAASPTAFGMALANVQAARAGEVSAPAPAQASVATPLTDPGFQQALGYQVSLLARDGIGHAELHLNPTDMGPVSVQITMTGDQAHVDFGADLAQTRQLIEAGWAELASSLKDAGFTLSGGGVSDHARERQSQPGQGAAQSFGGRLARDSGELPAVAPVVVRRVSGGVDVYA